MRRASLIVLLLIPLVLAVSPALAHHKGDHYPPGCQPGFSQGKSAQAPGCQKHQPTSLTRVPGENTGSDEGGGVTVGMITVAGLGIFAVYYLTVRRRRLPALRG